MVLVQTGVRVGEALGLTRGNVRLGDGAHIMVVEQVRRRKRKRLKTKASMARVPLSPTMAAWLSELRPEDVTHDGPVFASKTGTALNYSNVYHRVLQPALVKAAVAVQVGEVKVRGRDGDLRRSRMRSPQEPGGCLRPPAIGPGAREDVERCLVSCQSLVVRDRHFQRRT